MNDLRFALSRIFYGLYVALDGTIIIPKPVTNLKKISRQDFCTEMAKFGIEPISLSTPLDSSLYLAPRKELDRIAEYLKYDASYYAENILDCEDYGLMAQCDAALRFKVNSVRLTLGNMPLGYHGYAGTLSQEGEPLWLEPNVGFLYAGKWKGLDCEVILVTEKGKYVSNKIFV
jgi:hypothetical protein